MKKILKMNLLKSHWLILFWAVLALLLVSDVSAQNDQDKSTDRNSRSRDQGSRAPASSGSSRRRYDSGSQPGPTQPTLPKPPGNTVNSGRDSSPSRSQQNQQGDLQPERPARRPENANDPGRSTTIPNRQPIDRGGQLPERSSNPPPQPALRTKQTGNGQERVTASGQIREKIEKKADGEHTRFIAPTGRVQKEEIQKVDGTRQTVQYAPSGKVQKTVLVEKDGRRETTAVQYARNGKERATETVRFDARGREVSKTVVVKQNTVIVKNTTIVNNTTIVRNYHRARYGFVYRPVYVIHSPVFVSWYDPYWYGPSGVWISHPFHFSWGWDDYGWYRWHRHYWSCYEVYPTPSYWVTDWMIAGYVADRYAAAASLEQAREEARLAREDAERAREAAARAREDAEIAEAKAAEREAQARLSRAEALTVKAEAEEAKAKSRGNQPNPNATPIDPQTKEALRTQIEQAVEDKKEFAAQSAKGLNPVAPDISKALADPKHIYPVSRAIHVISAADQSPAGMLTEGDLLKLEPGQEAVLTEANENTFVTMRVMSSKGDDDEAKAGTLVSISLKSLQDFDSEFRAKLDLGLAEAEKNKDQFKNGAVNRAAK